MAAVIFDVDGTLIDSVDLHARAWVETLAHFGIEAAFEDIRANVGKGGDQLAPGFAPPDLLAETGEAIERYRSELFKSAYLAQVRPFPRVRELFERIRADGTSILIASSSKAPEVAAYLKIAGVEDLVDASTSSDDAERSKPFPDIFAAALAKVPGLAPEAAGVACVGVLCGGFSEASLEQAGCVAVYRDPAALLEGYAVSPLARVGGK